MPRRCITAAFVLAALASFGLASSAVAAPPRLAEGSPSGLQAIYWDDHSISGDNHLHWSDRDHAYTNNGGDTSDREPQAIRFGTTMTSLAGGLRVCGYPTGGSVWAAAYQVDAATCPSAAPATGAVGWFRYVYANHSADSPPAFNRWHLMDLERFALVPLLPAQGGASTPSPTVWDNHWGTCLDDSAGLSCQQTIGALSLSGSIAGGKPTQLGTDQAPDGQLIPIIPAVGSQLAGGNYQVVAMSNPYGRFAESGSYGSVNCVTVNVSVGTYGDVAISLVDPAPATCRVPATLDPGLVGPGGPDPMARAGGNVRACTTLVAPAYHCWTAAPETGPNPAAHTDATGNASIVPSVEVARGGPMPTAAVAPPVVTAAPRPPGTTASGGTVSATTRKIQIATTRARSALRRVFGTQLHGLRMACRLRTGGTAACNVTFTKRGARYTGKVYVRTKTVNKKLRWQYRVDVTKKKSGKTTHVRRDYRTGGLAG